MSANNFLTVCLPNLANDKNKNSPIPNPTDGLIISVKEARKILGKSYDEVRDDDLTGVILLMERLTIDTLQAVIVPQIRKV